MRAGDKGRYLQFFDFLLGRLLLDLQLLRDVVPGLQDEPKAHARAGRRQATDGFWAVAAAAGDSHASDALVHARVVAQRADLGVREVGVLLHVRQLLDLQVGQLHLLLRVDHLHLQLREGLAAKQNDTRTCIQSQCRHAPWTGRRSVALPRLAVFWMSPSSDHTRVK